MEKAFFESGQQYNVMVMNLSQGYNSNQLQGVQYFDTEDYDGITYCVQVFEEGTFINEGDGGYNNWAFRGWFERIGDDQKRSTFIDLNRIGIVKSVDRIWSALLQ